ncbi:hypothetical protein N7499_002069 [Penicillium canescens]|nr:hypothetical protein N7499_002069 [Penicillium canescens]KAJ6165684.1 hypothetical protein N7485_008928 [Penicillium canescens]
MLFAGDGDRRGDEIQVSPCPYMTIARRIFPSCGGGARATGGRHKDERENKADSDEYLSKENGPSLSTGLVERHKQPRKLVDRRDESLSR